MKKTYCREDVLNLFIATPVKVQDAILEVLNMTSQGMPIIEAITTIKDDGVREQFLSLIANA